MPGNVLVVCEKNHVCLEVIVICLNALNCSEFKLAEKRSNGFPSASLSKATPSKFLVSHFIDLKNTCVHYLL